jgi:hypothetical protein
MNSPGRLRDDRRPSKHRTAASERLSVILDPAMSTAAFRSALARLERVHQSEIQDRDAQIHVLKKTLGVEGCFSADLGGSSSRDSSPRRRSSRPRSPKHPPQQRNVVQCRDAPEQPKSHTPPISPRSLHCREVLFTPAETTDARDDEKHDVSSPQFANGDMSLEAQWRDVSRSASSLSTRFGDASGLKSFALRSSTTIMLESDVSEEVYEKLKAKVSEKSGKVFDVIMGILIVFSIVVLFLQMQWQGHETSIILGTTQDDDQWPNAKSIFDVLEYVFNLLFLTEICIQLYRHGRQWLTMPANAFDAIIVGASSFDTFILQHSNIKGLEDVGIASILRVARIVRVLRAFRFAKHVRELRVLLHAVKSSLGALFWSVVLLGSIIVAGGILLAQIMTDIIRDEELSYEFRVWSFERYGDGARSTYTMFEATLSGAWPSLARPTIEKGTPLLALFWIPYVVLVWFAVLRIISALFLKHTMEVASSDHEMMAMEKMKQKQTFGKKLFELFEAADSTGSGLVSAAEFQEVFSDEQAWAALQALELEVYEVSQLFNLLDNGRGEISFDEFLGGAMRLKGHSRALDTVAIMHEQHTLCRMVSDLHDAMFKQNLLPDKASGASG